MCDTLYAWPWFAKNSDRHPEEAQGLVLVPARDQGAEICVGGRLMPGKDLGLGLALSKPSWIEGAEMGVNAAGLALGNEAVFSKDPADPRAPLGMDLIRACLMATDTARGALEWLIACVEDLGQGGNGAYRGRLVYDNAFLMADGKEAYVLETAGRRWAWKSLVGLGTISNVYSIHRDFEGLDSESAKEFRGMDKHKVDWAAAVGSRLYPLFTRGRTRAALTKASLEEPGDLDLPRILGALRQHGDYIPGRRGSLASPCVHEGGFPVNNATTASLAMSWSPATSRAAPRATLWFSGVSYPCLSLYKPILLTTEGFLPLWTDNDYDEFSGGCYETWARHLAWIRKDDHSSLSLDPGFVFLRDEAQANLASLAAEAEAQTTLSRSALESFRGRVNGIVAAWERALEGF